MQESVGELLGAFLDMMKTRADHGGAVLSAAGLVAGFGKTPVCEAVSLELHAGTSLAIVGPNGAGKSTVARTLSGQQPPLSGQVFFQGQPVDERTAFFRSSVAAVFDEDAFFPGLTVAEHLLMTARGHQVDNPEQAVAAELDYFELGSRSGNMPNELSSGQRRRLLLASAFIRPATLLVLDEPEQRLDLRLRGALATRLRSVAKNGCALLLITHDPALLVDAADQCLLVDEQVTFLSPRAAAAVISA